MVVLLIFLILFVNSQLIPDRLAIVVNQSSQCFLVRGNLPISNLTFQLQYLKQQLSRLTSLPHYELVVVNLLNFMTAKETRNRYIEEKFFDGHPEITYISHPIIGHFVSPSNKWLRKIYEFWKSLYDFDNIDTLIHTLHSHVTLCNKPRIIFIHCSAGIDRTGYVSGAYRMKWKNQSLQTVMKVNNHHLKNAVDRPMHFHCYNAIRWYCLSMSRSDEQCDV